MVKSVLARLLLITTLALGIAGPASTQDDPGPEGLDAVAVALVVQQERIERVHERIDAIRIGSLRDRIRTLERAVAELADAFAAVRFTIVAAREGKR